MEVASTSRTEKELYSYEDIKKIADYLKGRINTRPKIGIVCGSGLGSIGKLVSSAIVLKFTDIPNFPVTTVPGHEGNLIFGLILGVPVMVMQGRFHYYEGYSLSKCVMPIRLMKLLGVTSLIISNAAGGINKEFRVGDIMIIKDHLNIMGIAGHNPLIGPNEREFGKRFPSMREAYDAVLIHRVTDMAKKYEFRVYLKEGIYANVGGPNYETVAEIRALQILGADAVGMSTVHEIIAARHCEMTCFAFSLITNACSTQYGLGSSPSHIEVIDAAKRQEDVLKVFVEKVVRVLDDYDAGSYTTLTSYGSE